MQFSILIVMTCRAGKSDAMVTIRGKPEVDPQDASPDTPCQAETSRSNNDSATSQPLPLTVVFGSHRNTKLKICGSKECLLLVCFCFCCSTCVQM